MDDPISPNEMARSGKAQKLARLLPGNLYAVDDRRSWHGAGHLGGLPDVSFLALPDLPALSASAPTVAAAVVSAVAAGPRGLRSVRRRLPILAPIPLFPLPAPRLTPDDYANRMGAERADSSSSTCLKNGIREIQFVAAFPLAAGSGRRRCRAKSIERGACPGCPQRHHQQMPENIRPASTRSRADPGLSTAFLQLAYPWLTTTGSHVLNESLEPPDGALVGLLARNALTRGAFMDATKIVPAEISDLWPSLPAQELPVPVAPLVWGGNSWKPLITRLSLFGFTPAGLRLLSDVTAYPGEAYRPARVHRLVSVISRARGSWANESSSSRTVRRSGKPWKSRWANLLTQLWTLNALDGDTRSGGVLGALRCQHHDAKRPG